ncbi:MAG: glycosyltransferase, partial [Elusimicrobiales bacterium]|nr:glycosyltransferase [Elusimicrobiales bacterium]
MKAIYIIPSFRNFSPVNGNINIVSGINDLLDIEMLALDSDFDDTIIEKLEQKRIKFRILNCDGFLNIFRSYKKIEQIVYKNNIKVIFSSLLRPDLISYLLSRKKLCRISIARDFVDLQYFNNYNYITAKVFGYLHFKILKSMDYIIVISEEMKNHFLNHGIDEDKILVTNNFLDEDMLKKMAYDSNTNGYVIPNINYNKIIFITSSILIKRKNIHSVLKIMKELSDEGFSFQYIILGDGEEKENLMSFCKNAKIDDKVFFLGFQENPWIYLNNADVYISASLSEG